MKRTLLFLLLFAIFSCKTDPKNDIQDNSTEKTEIVNKSESGKKLPKFATLKEMFKDAGDFNEEVGTLKFISLNKNKLHVQVSKPILENDSENVKDEIVKRDIIYVAFQTFAQTEIDELTITAVPNSNSNPKQYFTAPARILSREI